MKKKYEKKNHKNIELAQKPKSKSKCKCKNTAKTNQIWLENVKTKTCVREDKHWKLDRQIKRKDRQTENRTER